MKEEDNDIKKKSIENSILIICDKCSEENKILLSKDIKCKKCDKSLIGSKYKEYIISGFTTILIGVGIGAVADSYVNIQRPSVKTEYKMMKSCINFQSISDSNTIRVRDNCFCAVESMAGIVDAQKARLYGDKWLKDILIERYESCIN
ncbi:hypothetical protein ACN2C0_01440 [Aliarcobacter butzleri]|uniref:hypothetical protein n=1 Tax=Aliarcobacter butzleri TaxID=28197 RepID=UPI0021B46588|nr:hypothetical protein [Aliarcobacter butzleri]MCT7560690.1 hypothetical protein [Aliarcobacter butzleri]MCT7627086.1 hypothetical protein [Aliarcobacter butzleri]UWY61026.1 hypothetical protein N3115_04145 [Aliarcobacter butzleri]